MGIFGHVGYCVDRKIDLFLIHQKFREKRVANAEKAVSADRRDVRRQQLIEATISVIGRKG